MEKYFLGTNEFRDLEGKGSATSELGDSQNTKTAIQI